MLIDAIRSWQISQLEKGISILKNIMESASSEAITTYRDGGNGWTALEVLCHMRDFEDVFYERARLTVEFDNPDLPFPNPEQLVEERNYNADNPTMVLSHWVALRKEHIQFLRERHDANWERISEHPTRGAFTLHDQLFLTVWHDTNHFEQIIRILKERR